jgi:hypothetical protein
MAREPFEKLRAIDFISHRLKSLPIIFFLSIANSCLFAQTKDCAFYVESDQTRKKIRHSLYPLNFVVTENIEVTLKINDKGSHHIIELMFDFEDASGLPTELGSTLAIKFKDGTTHSIIARTKKVNASMIYFTLTESGLKDTRSLIEKLSNVEIAVLTIIADYKSREISIPETKASIIRQTIQCLHDTTGE